jgi:hypothetical protein
MKYEYGFTLLIRLKALAILKIRKMEQRSF